MFHLYTPWKQKTGGFRMFSGGIEVEHWFKMDETNLSELINFCSPLGENWS